MSEKATTRRLVAILIADVVGYSRLMETDEAGTLAALRQRRTEVLAPVVKGHGGRIVKLMGDGVLVEFASAVKAVEAALELQEKMARANEDVPEERRIRLRVGINLGDVIGDGSDIYGEGVNIAARLEALAEPGGVCVSDKVHAEVRGKFAVAFADLGECQLKNIATPVRAYLARSGSTPPSSPAAVSDKPSIAVLPFANLSGDPEQAYFADGITEDIITELSRFKSVFVIARNSSFVFRGQSADLREVGRKLGVKYLVEGSVRKAGSRIRITAQLIEAASGNHIWAERYDRDLVDVLQLQDEVVRTIVSTIGGRIEVAGKEQARRLSDEGLRAYDLCLRAAAAQDRNTRADYRRARDYLIQAVRHDPSLAQAYHQLSLVSLIEWMAFWIEDRARAFDDAVAAARQSLALDGSNSGAHAHFGMLLMYRGETDEADFHFARALDLNPDDSRGRALYGFYLTAMGRPEEALASFELAQRLNPFQPDWTNWLKGIAYFTARRYREAIIAFKSINAPMNEVRGWLAASYAQAGDEAQARAMLATFLQVAQAEMAVPPAATLSAWKPFWHGAIPYRSEADVTHLYDGLRRAGMAD